MKRRVFGFELEVQSILVTLDGCLHVIDHFSPYPGRFFDVHGECDHVRVAYAVDGSEYTITDHSHWNIDVPEETWNTKSVVTVALPVTADTGARVIM